MLLNPMLQDGKLSPLTYEPQLSFDVDLTFSMIKVQVSALRMQREGAGFKLAYYTFISYHNVLLCYICGMQRIDTP